YREIQQVLSTDRQLGYRIGLYDFKIELSCVRRILRVLIDKGREVVAPVANARCTQSQTVDYDLRGSTAIVQTHDDRLAAAIQKEVSNRESKSAASSQSAKHALKVTE